jgi:hypothetical protein
MSDPVSSARSARERLAQALAALQSPGVPAAVLGVAEPVAQAMSALHQIESTNGSARLQAGPKALDGVRRALAALQGDASNHPAVARAIEAVAGSLGLVHGLSAAAPAAPAAPAQGLAYAGTMVADTGHVAPATQPSGGQRFPMPQPAAPQPAAAPPMQPAAAHAPTHPAAPAQVPPGGKPAATQQPVVAGSLLRVNAELGVHSATNFYKGLSGNDLFDSGGIFIATYQIPTIGRELLIHVSMPGGYEFDAKGTVRWTREAPLSAAGGMESPPGFGAQFTEISPEGRHLIQRYVRNREPLFHDDL